MKQASWQAGVISLLLGLLCGEIARRVLERAPVSIPLASFIPILGVAAALAWFGWQVRKLRKHEEASINRIGAARVWAFAQAAIRVGSFLTGMSGVVAIGYFTGLATAWTGEQTLAVVLTALANLVLVIVGYLVEHWCRILPDDGDEDSDPGKHRGPEPTPAAAHIAGDH